MNKKFTKVAALSIAAVTAISAMALPVSADVTTRYDAEKGNVASGTVWKVNPTSYQLIETVYTLTWEGPEDTGKVVMSENGVGTPVDLGVLSVKYYSSKAKATAAKTAIEDNKKAKETAETTRRTTNGITNLNTVTYAAFEALGAGEKVYKTYSVLGTITLEEVSLSAIYNVGDEINIGADGVVTQTAGGTYEIVAGGTTGGGNGGGTGGGTTTPINPGIGTYYPTSESDRMTPGNISYLGANGKFYTTYSNALYYGGGVRGSIANNWSTYSGTNDKVYFDALDGQYYLTTGTYRYVVRNATTTYYSTSYGSYLSANGLYYPTISAAKNASYNYNGTTTYTTKYTVATARYFSMNTGKFYDTYSAALAASTSSSYVIDLADYNGYNYYDPYYYYNYYYYTPTTKKIDPDAATIYGSSKKSGWTVIKSYITYASKNSTIKIDMKKQTSVPSSILSAAKTRGVNLQLILPNGVKWTINYKDIADTSSALDITTTYNMKVIPNSLVKKAKKANKDVVSTAQIKIGGSSYLPAAADVTVKLPAKRSGCTVKAYRYTSSGSLKLVDTSKVTNTGAVTLDIEDGGYYLLVVCD